MEGPPGVPPVSDRAFRTVRQAGRALVTVLAGADPAPTWRSPWQRRVVYAALTVTTLACCWLSLASVAELTGRIQLTNFFWGQAVIGRPRSAPVRARALHPPVFHAPKLHPPVFQAANQYMPSILGHGGGVSALLTNPGGSIVIGLLVALAVVTPLPLAARYPLMGWRIGWLGLLLVPLAHVTWTGGWPWDTVQLVVLVVVFCAAGVRVPRAALWWMWALTLSGWWVHAARGHPRLMVAVAGTVVLTLAASAADAAGGWRRARRALVSQAEQTELEQARRAVLEERARIARELHDVVAHHMSLIAVRAESAPFRLAGLGDPVAAEFAALSGGARSALADMRRLLGVLRQDQPAALAPAPQLADVPALVEGARRAGVVVALSQGVAPERVPPPVGVCAYRIVQESLSNASRHAPGAAVSVRVSHDHDSVVLRVENGPPAPASRIPAQQARPSEDAPANGRAPANGHARLGGRPANGRRAVNAHRAVSELAAVNGHGAVNGLAAGERLPADELSAVNGLAADDRLPAELSAMNGLAAAAGQASNGQALAGEAGLGGAGHGLAGMRERVALLGGTLSAGPSPDGGFVVTAVLPTGQAA